MSRSLTSANDRETRLPADEERNKETRSSIADWIGMKRRKRGAGNYVLTLLIFLQERIAVSKHVACRNDEWKQ